MSTNERPRCACCGKLIRLRTHDVKAPTLPNSHLPVAGWRYTGNHRVVARKYDDCLINPENEREWKDMRGRTLEDLVKYDSSFASRAYYDNWKRERRLSSVSVWDGESYLPVDGYFCSHLCSANFAEAAYRAGYRMKAKQQPA